jgi:DNA-binding response OmpR family regulator
MLALDPLPDLVLLDVMLPRIDGYALLQRLARLSVVIVSGVADRHEDVGRAKALGADDYIVKPLMEYHFLGCIARLAQQQKK